jgi:hypothetical protein
MDVSDYRLAPALGARFAGGLLVLLAVVLLVVTGLVSFAGLPPLVLVVVAVAGLAVVGVATLVVARRVAVVHLDTEGYRVRLVRGVGVAAAAWTEVEEVVTAAPGGVPVLVLRLTRARSTTIPVRALAADREEFVRDLREHLRRGQGLRPL